MSHTWTDLAVAAGVAREDADYMLWNASAFPFAGVRETYRQLKHTVRHRECIDLLPDQDEDGEFLSASLYQRGRPHNCWPKRLPYARTGRHE